MEQVQLPLLWDDFNEASINTDVNPYGSPIISNGVIELPFGSLISSTIMLLIILRIVRKTWPSL